MGAGDGYRPFSADGHQARWTTWSGDGEELTRIAWENEGWTISGQVGAERVEYVVRVSPLWQVRQFMLFRDLDEPDLWLARDATGGWGEVNGAQRPELAGCHDIDLACTPFTNTLPIRRLSLAAGEAAEVRVVMVDAATLGTHPEVHRYTRLASHRWAFEQLDTGYAVELDVDEHGLVIDYPDRFRRL